MRRNYGVVLLFPAALLGLGHGYCQHELPTRLRIETLEGEVTLPSRITLRDASGEIQVPSGEYKYHQSFTCSGETILDVTPGIYSLEVRRGLEYQVFQTNLEIPPGSEMEVAVPLDRWIDLNAMGWYGGDLHVHRAIEVIPRLMLAEDLNLCAVQSMWNIQSFWKNKRLPDPLVQKVDDRHAYHVLSEEDEREGGAVMLYNLKSPINIAVPSRFYPSSLGFIEDAVGQGGWVEEEKPFWWEAPVNIALGGIRSTEIVNNHFCENSLLNNEAWGRPRDANKYSSEPIGFCHYVLDLYYSFLNAGFPLIPTAGSATGVLPNPLGYNRCYVYCGNDFSYENWWKNLVEGKHFVTNGPALFVEFEGQPHWRRLAADIQEARVRIEARTRQGITGIEVIGDGKVIASHVPEGQPNVAVWETSLPCAEESWLAVRVFESAENTVRFAHTAPTFIENRTSRFKQEAGQFFLDWIDVLLKRVEDNPDRFPTPDAQNEMRQQYRMARERYTAIVSDTESNGQR